jgi:hypothetical protein
MTERHFTRTALYPIAFSNVGQVLPLEVLRNIARCMEFANEVFHLWVIWWQRQRFGDAEKASPRSLLLVANEDGLYSNAQRAVGQTTVAGYRPLGV